MVTRSVWGVLSSVTETTVMVLPSTDPVRMSSNRTDGAFIGEADASPTAQSYPAQTMTDLMETPAPTITALAVPALKKAGRPFNTGKRTKEKATQICQLLRTGLSFSGTAGACGIAQSTLHQW